MGNNFFTLLTAEDTPCKAEYLNVPSEELDAAITYLKNFFISCDGTITYNSSTGVLTWSDTIRILFNRTNGETCENTIAAGNVTLTDNQFAYVDLSETDGQAVSCSAATVTTDAASNFIAYNRLVLGYRNAASDKFYPVALNLPIAPICFAEKCNGAPGASAIIMHLPMVTAVTFPAGLTGSQGVLGVAATAQTDFDIQIDGVSFGTMRFAIAGTVATFIAASAQAFAVGEVLKVIAPAVPDATAADLGFILAGTA